MHKLCTRDYILSLLLGVSAYNSAIFRIPHTQFRIYQTILYYNNNTIYQSVVHSAS